MKKTIILLVILFQVNFSWSQSFHFVNYSTVLIKDTDQSPAHWYIEVYNDAGIDTVLRWKAFFQNIPAAWQIDLDVQTNYTTDIQDGDSMDFDLPIGLAFPQKLIIGATLNGTPGVGSAFFEIYDPNVSTVIDTIEFYFIVAQGTASISLLDESEWVVQKNNILEFSNEYLDNELIIYSINGEELFRGNITSKMNFSAYNFDGVIFVTTNNGKPISKKIYWN